MRRVRGDTDGEKAMPTLSSSTFPTRVSVTYLPSSYLYNRAVLDLGLNTMNARG